MSAIRVGETVVDDKFITYKFEQKVCTTHMYNYRAMNSHNSLCLGLQVGQLSSAAQLINWYEIV